MHSLFFSLVQLSLGTIDKLSRHPSEKEWKGLYHIALKQALVGICFLGVKKHIETLRTRKVDSNIPKKLYMQWLGAAAQIQQRNELMNSRCVELQSQFSLRGINSSILKGQGIAVLYGMLQNLRVPGDIDVYVDCGRKATIEYAHSIHQKYLDWDYKHLHLNIFKETEVEVHYRPEVFLNLVKNRKLQRWFLSNETQRQIFQQNGSFVTPSTEFNLFYILLHIYRHFLYEGVGLRQLMDYYFVLKATCEQEYRSNAKRVIEMFGMTRFAKGMMWIMQTIFGLEKQYLLYEPNEKEGRYILEQVMTGGNFGHFDDRLNTVSGKGKLNSVRKILKHNLHLLSHYPSDVIWAPIWIVYHWCWKRVVR